MGLRLLAASPILSRHSRFAKGSPWEQGMATPISGSAPPRIRVVVFFRPAQR